LVQIWHSTKIKVVPIYEKQSQSFFLFHAQEVEIAAAGKEDMQKMMMKVYLAAAVLYASDFFFV